jgi:divalent metal cation (Fe/Co/Zn/Cd) transporter
LFDGASFVIALKNFNRQRGSTPFWKAVRRSKDPTSFVVLFEDASDLVGLLIAFAGIYLGHRFQNPYFDGIAAILIGLLLTAVSIVLTRECRSLLMGEPASEKTMEGVVKLVEANKAVEKVQEHLSMILSPTETLIILKPLIKEDSSSREIALVIEEIKQSVQGAYPSMRQIYIEPIFPRSESRT